MEKRIYTIGFTDLYDYNEKTDKIMLLSRKEEYNIYFGISINKLPNNLIKIELSPNGIMHNNPNAINDFIEELNYQLS